MIYLDNAATTYPKPENVYKRMDEFSRNGAVNAGRGSYNLAQDATQLIEETRDVIKELVNINNDADVIFSPSITFAMNQVINGLQWNKGDVVYLSPYEHNAVARTLSYCKKKNGIEIRELPIDPKTFLIDVDRMRYEFSKNRPKAIFCTHISNVTGYILPVEDIFMEGRKYNSINILDTAQSLGLIDVDAKDLNVDIIAFTAHKSLYGPIGIGGFINVSGIDLDVVFAGGTGSDSLNLDMPEDGPGKYEAGSQNIVAIAGLNEALKCIDRERVFEHEKLLTVALREALANINGIKVLLPADLNKHIGIVSFVVKDMKSDDVADILNEDFEIAVRSGYHCAPFIHKYLKDERLLGTVRVGIGQFNSIDDINILIESIKEVLVG